MQTLLVSPGELGAQLREMRNRMDLTQAELGKRVGLDQKRVSLLENGNPNCRLDSLFRLLSALEVALTVQPKVEPTPRGGDAW